MQVGHHLLRVVDAAEQELGLVFVIIVDWNAHCLSVMGNKVCAQRYLCLFLAIIASTSKIDVQKRLSY